MLQVSSHIEHLKKEWNVSEQDFWDRNFCCLEDWFYGILSLFFGELVSTYDSWICIKMDRDHCLSNKWYASCDKNIQKYNFSRFRVPRLVINDGGSHFIARKFENLLKKYKVHHRVVTPYYPQTSGKVEVFNKEIKTILEKIPFLSGKDWSSKLDDALWTYWTTYKTLIGMTHFKLIYGKSYHLPLELEHKVYWAIKVLNLDYQTTWEKRKLQLSELEEIQLDVYENANFYK